LNRPSGVQARGRGRWFKPRVEELENRVVLSTLTVTSIADSGPDTLRAEIAQANTDAASGISDVINFDASLNNQTIALASQLELSGSGSGVITINGADEIAVSGNNSTRVFQIDPGVTAVFEGMTIEEGLVAGSSAQGGGIYNTGSLTLSDATVWYNRAIANGGSLDLATFPPPPVVPGTAEGGGIFNAAGGFLTLNSGTVVEANTALGQNGADGLPGANDANGEAGGDGGGGGQALGGGIYNDGGAVTFEDFTLVANTAQGGNGGGGGQGGMATIATFGNPGNGGAGGDGGKGGQALGGGIFNKAGSVTMTGETMTPQGSGAIYLGSNRVIGGYGGSGGYGGYPLFGTGGPGGEGGDGGQALGGTIYNSGGTVSLKSSSFLLFLEGTATGGLGGIGGVGGVAFELPGSGGNGGNAGMAALAAGGAIYNTDNGSVSVDIQNGGSIEGTAFGGTYYAPTGGSGGFGAYGGNAGFAKVGGAAEGGAIYNGTGSVTIVASPNPAGPGVSLAGEAVGGVGGFGGAGGTITSVFGLTGYSTPGASGGTAAGGALYNDAETVTLSNLTIDGAAQGGMGGWGGSFGTPDIQGILGNGGFGGQALGGGIYSGGGSVSVDSSTFNLGTPQNLDPSLVPFPVPFGATGGAGGMSGSGEAAGAYSAGSGGNGLGGAIAVAGGTFTLTNSTLSSSAGGGVGGTGGTGGTEELGFGTVGGYGGRGGDALGGAINLSGGTMNLTNCTLSGNEALGGNGGQGGAGGSGAFGDNGAPGQQGGDGGNGQGGAIEVQGGTLYLNSNTIAGNQAIAGAGGAGGQGAIVLEVGSTVIYASNGAAGSVGSGLGGGLFVWPLVQTPFGVFGGTAQIQNTIVATNAASTADSDIDGTVTSEGYNLVGDGTGSSGFSAAGDQVGTTADPINPRLGVLQNNGGPTATMALLPGSPAIGMGGGPNSPGTDQRGVSRPQGQAIDIGAFES
jgi:hypothetical protein